MAYEERFIEIGNKFAIELAAAYRLELSDELKEFCRQWKFDWFVAECSDDYSKTASEQRELTNNLKDYIFNVERNNV